MSARDPALEAACLANLDDDGVRLVYGDWLQRHGDPRGELIALQHALLTDPRSVAMRRREAELLDAHGADFVGPTMVPKIHVCDWRCGFVRAADVDLAQLGELLASPCGLLVEKLEIVDDVSLQPAIDLLAHNRPPLRRLVLDSSLPTPLVDGDAVGSLDALWPALPRLAYLELSGDDIELGAIDAPDLVELEVQPEVLQPELARALDEASWPALQRLELWFCRRRMPRRPAPHPSPVRLEQLPALLAGTAAPRLDALGLVNTWLGDAIIDAIVRAPIAPRLRSLDLRHNEITAEGAHQLAASRARFPRLERVDLSGNRFDDARSLDGLCREIRV